MEHYYTKLFRVTTNFVEKALGRVIDEEDMRREILVLASNRLEDGKKRASEELQNILDDEKRQPITYNHYHTDNIQKAREESFKKSIQKAVRGAVEEDWKGKFHVSNNNNTDSEKLFASLPRRVICQHGRSGMC